MLEVQNLGAFVAIADQGSFSAAATHLGVSQPRVSLLLQRLEDQIGFPLFIRTTRSLKLTSEGTAFLGRARALLDLHEQTVRAARELRDQSQERIRLGAPYFTSDVPARAALLSAFLADSPRHRAEIRHGGNHALSKGLLSGEFDFILSAARTAPEPDLETLQLSRALLCIGHLPGHAFARQSTLSLSQLRDQEIAVLPRDSMDSRFDAWFGTVEKAGARFVEAPERVVSTLVQFGMLRSLPVLLYRWLGQTSEPDLRWLPIADEGLFIPLHLLRVRGRALRPAARQFWEIARTIGI